LGVIQRSTTPSTYNHDSKVDDMDVRQADASDAVSSQWDMVAIVKKKIVFSKRPMPIVGKAAIAMSSGGKKG
jgi:chromosome transmission fidelity protein 8